MLNVYSFFDAFLHGCLRGDSLIVTRKDPIECTKLLLFTERIDVNSFIFYFLFYVFENLSDWWFTGYDMIHIMVRLKTTK